MGRQRDTLMTYGGKRRRGRALLESDHLLFRGDVRLKIPFGDITALEARRGTLHVAFAGEAAAFDLGAEETVLWLGKIRNPPSLLDKLGVKPDDVVCVLGVDDDRFRRDLTARLTSAPRPRLKKGASLIFHGAETPAALERLAALRDALQPNGAIWVVSRKGKGATIKDTEVMAAAKTAGLVDTKVASFSATRTALKLVIPRALR